MIRGFLNKHKTARALLWLVLLVYIAWILRITVFRSDFGQHPFFSGEINWGIMTNYLKIINNGYPDIAAFYFFGNIGVFIPFGIFLAVLLDRPFLRCAIDGFLFSFLIETAQYVFGVGFSEVDDLILNTIGVMIGWCLTALVQKFIRGRQPHAGEVQE